MEQGRKGSDKIIPLNSLWLKNSGDFVSKGRFSFKSSRFS